MKFNSDISPLRKTLFFILGLLVAAFVVSQEVISHHCAKLTIAQEQSSDDADEEQNDMIYEYSCDVMLPAATDLVKPFTPVFLREIIRESEEPQFPELQVPLHDTQYFKTLFRQIISPNAP